MQTLTSEEVHDRPQRLLDDAKRGQPDIVTVDGEPVMLTLPIGVAAGSSNKERMALAVTLYERDLVSLGLATKVAGVSYSAMVDELGRHGIPTVRYSVEDLAEELSLVNGLAGRR